MKKIRIAINGADRIGRAFLKTARERKELETDIEHERKELASIYVSRGLTPELAKQVSDQLMAHDALGAHARDELGITENLTARPAQAAFSSAAAFSIGAALPLLTVLIAPSQSFGATVAVTSLIFLGLMGALASKTGGAPILKGIFRVTFWGALAMGLTAGVGALFGAK